MSTATTTTTAPTEMTDTPQQPAQRFGSRLTENFVKDTSPPQYLCGSCGVKNNLVSGERVSCKVCGYKILYKARQREGGHAHLNMKFRTTLNVFIIHFLGVCIREPQYRKQTPQTNLSETNPTHHPSHHPSSPQPPITPPPQSTMFSAQGANRYEQAARKSLAKLGLKQIEGVSRVTLKIDGTVYGMTNPDVAHLPGTDLYIVFGQPANDSLMSRLGKNPEAMAAMQGMGGMGGMDMAGMGGMDMNFGSASTEAAAEEEEEEGEVDEEGLDAEEIESIVSQVGCSRAKAAKTLRKTGTLVDAIIELSSL